MKIYTERNKEADSVEISLNYQELRKMVISLKKFEDKVSQFKLKNKDKKDLGSTHLHLQDCGITGENSKSDVVFYVNLNE